LEPRDGFSLINLGGYDFLFIREKMATGFHEKFSDLVPKSFQLESAGDPALLLYHISHRGSS